MFNDFKNLNFSTTKQKIRKLKDLFDRLRLNDFEERLKRLTLSINNVDKKVSYLQEDKEEHPENYPPGIPPTPPEPPEPPEPPTLPDLAITSLIPTVDSDGVSFEITIINNGLGTSPGTTLNGNLYGQTLHSVPVPSLEPSEQFITNIEFSFDSEGESVSRTFFAEVNPSHNFIEDSYGNNTASTIVTIKEAFVPDPEKAYLIVHAHNPEGKEINGILNEYSAYVYIDGNPLFYAPKLLSEHRQRHDVTGYVGTHTFTVRFNGMESEGQIVDVQLGTTTELVFTIPRTDAPFDYERSGISTLISPEDFNNGFYTFNRALDPFNLYYPSIYPYHVPPGIFTASLILDKEFFSFSMDILCSPSIYHAMGVYSNRYYGWVIPISIPAQSFTRWYAQSIIIGDYPSITIGPSPDPNENVRGLNFIYHTDVPIYEVLTPDADIHYTTLLIEYLQDPYIAGLGNSSLNLSGQLIGGLKLSSVPYDLDGTAF